MINSRCIKGVLSESDYNQTWIVHNAMSEALELLTHFLTEVSGVNMFTASNRTSGHISSMIKGVEYPFAMVSTIFHNQKSKSNTEP